MRHEGVKPVCALETRLDDCDLKRKNNKWYHLRQVYNLAEFDVKLLIGTGLQFEIWGQQGRKSKTHEEIEVDWESADDPEPYVNGTKESYGMYKAT